MYNEEKKERRKKYYEPQEEFRPDINTSYSYLAMLVNICNTVRTYSFYSGITFALYRYIHKSIFVRLMFTYQFVSLLNRDQTCIRLFFRLLFSLVGDLLSGFPVVYQSAYDGWARMIWTLSNALHEELDRAIRFTCYFNRRRI